MVSGADGQVLYENFVLSWKPGCSSDSLDERVSQTMLMGEAKIPRQQ